MAEEDTEGWITPQTLDKLEQLPEDTLFAYICTENCTGITTCYYTADEDEAQELQEKYEKGELRCTCCGALLREIDMQGDKIVINPEPDIGIEVKTHPGITRRKKNRAIRERLKEAERRTSNHIRAVVEDALSLDDDYEFGLYSITGGVKFGVTSGLLQWTVTENQLGDDGYLTAWETYVKVLGPRRWYHRILPLPSRNVMHIEFDPTFNRKEITVYDPQYEEAAKMIGKKLGAKTIYRDYKGADEKPDEKIMPGGLPLLCGLMGFGTAVASISGDADLGFLIGGILSVGFTVLISRAFRTAERKAGEKDTSDYEEEGG